MFSYQKFRLKRALRKTSKQSLVLRSWFINYLNRHVFGGWNRLERKKWFFVGWLLLICFCIIVSFRSISNLDHYYLQQGPQSGGTYSEGLVGQITRLNPILPENSASKDVASIVFSGLTKVDGDRKLVGDLADSWDISKDYKTYTFHLRDNIFWQDGERLKADDVAFTVSLIQNSETLSPLASDWSGIKNEVVDSKTIKFILPNPYPSFINNTTVGILPRHKLSGVKPSQLKLSEFNQKPVGSGPFMVDSFDGENSNIILKPNDRYYIKKPFLKKIKFVSYKTDSDLIDAYIKREIMGISRIDPSNLEKAKKLENLKIYQFSLPSYVGLFLNNKSGLLSDINVRHALSYATDRKKIVNDLMSNSAIVVDNPILPSYLGYNPVAIHYDFDLDKAKSILGQSFIYNQQKNKELILVSLDDSQSVALAQMVKDQWESLGIKIKLKSANLEDLQKNYIKPRNYDILLYGQNIGLDSDVYSFWHSSQVNDPGLNLTYYKSVDADRLIEDGRFARDSQTKSSKYYSFADTWAKDQPAILLYNPYYIYGVEKIVSGINASKIVEPSDRFYNIQDWAIKKHLELKIKKR